MNFLAPLAFAVFGLSLPLVLLYFLKVRRRERRVPSLLLWQAAERILHPAPVVGSIAVVVGLLAAAANWGVARLLLGPSRNNAAIRLAYIHNIGDVYVSLVPVAANVMGCVSPNDRSWLSAYDCLMPIASPCTSALGSVSSAATSWI